MYNVQLEWYSLESRQMYNDRLEWDSVDSEHKCMMTNYNVPLWIEHYW